MTMRTGDTAAKSEVRAPKGDRLQVPRDYPFLPSVTESHPNQTQNADSPTPSIPAAYRSGQPPRRRSVAKAQQPPTRTQPGLDVFPAMTDEEMSFEELLFLLMRLLNPA